MIFLKFFIGFLALGLVYVIYRTIKLSTMESPNFPEEEEEVHLFAERPYTRKSQKQDFGGIAYVSQKNKVITHLMMNGTISKAEAKEMAVNRLPMHIFRLRKMYKIDNVIVDGKFVHYKLIEFKGK